MTWHNDQFFMIIKHIYCVGKYFMDFQIPTDLRYLWRYMLHMYQLDAFTQSCPADQDIVNHYKQQQVCNNVRPNRCPSPLSYMFYMFCVLIIFNVVHRYLLCSRHTFIFIFFFFKNNFKILF